MDLKVFIILAFVALLVQSKPLEDDAADFIAFVDATMSDYLNDINNRTALTGVTLSSIPDMENLVGNITEIAVATREFKYKEYKNENIKMALKHINLSLIQALTNYMLTSLDIEVKFNKHKHKSIVCKYLDESEDCKMNFIDILLIVAFSTDLEEIKFYWKSWRDRSKEEMKVYLTNHIELYQLAAMKIRTTPSTMYTSSFMEPDFINDMENVMNELKPYYQQFHTYIGSILQEQYGDAAVTSSGKIRHDVFELLLEKYTYYLPATILNSTTKSYFQEHNYTIRTFAEKADSLFKSMGFEQLPNEFWTNRFVERTDCKGFKYKTELINNVPKSYIISCPKDDYLSYLNMHSHMSVMHYANQKKDLPFSFFNSYNLDYAVGNAVVHSATSLSYMKRIPVKSETDIAKDQTELRRVKYITSMMKLPVQFVHTKVMLDLLSKNIELAKVNEHYWQLMDKYVGVVPPVKRGNNDLDLPLSFYAEAVKDTAERKFFSNVVGYQLYEGLCAKGGRYNTDKPEQLRNCNFYGNKIIGSTLKEMMHEGSKKPWKQVLKIVTGNDNGMSILPFVHYHHKMINKVKEQIKDKQPVIVW